MCLITAMKEMHNTHIVFYPGELPPSILNNKAAQLTAVYPGFKNEHVHVCMCERTCGCMHAAVHVGRLEDSFGS